MKGFASFYQNSSKLDLMGNIWISILSLKALRLMELSNGGGLKSSRGCRFVSQSGVNPESKTG